jgi:hypothetical protein
MLEDENQIKRYRDTGREGREEGFLHQPPGVGSALRRRGTTVPEAKERIGRMLLGWGCVSWDNQGPIVICDNERDLVGAKLAVG